MKTLIYRLLIIFSACILFSCEKIVDLDLKTIEPRNVIDASITVNAQCKVILSKTQAFSNNNPYEGISGATIILTCSDGTSETLQESYPEPGIYYSSMTGKVNHTYNLKVSIGNDFHEARATIPEAVPIDNVYVYPITAGDQSWYSPSIIFQDPPGVPNYYYTLVTVNDKLLRSIYINDDEYRDGLEIHRILFFDKEENNDKELETGDYIEIEMQSLDVGMYNFYKTLFSVAEGTNPTSNFTGGVLGCFKAYNSSYASAYVSQDIIFKEEDYVSLWQ